MLIRLDHLGKVVTRTSKLNTLLLEQIARSQGGRLADLVEGQFAVNVVVGVGDVDGFLGDEGVVL